MYIDKRLGGIQAVQVSKWLGSQVYERMSGV